jgi:hypothetical protein
MNFHQIAKIYLRVISYVRAWTLFDMLLYETTWGFNGVYVAQPDDHITQHVET